MAKEKILAFKIEVGGVDQDVVSINKLNAANKALRAELRDVNLLTKEGQKRRAEINIQIDKNTRIIRENSDALVKQKMNIGNYSSALKGLGNRIAGALGITAIIYAMTRAFRAAAKLVEDFDAKVSTLGSVLVKTKDEMKLLTNQAVQLGATTKFLATDILDLQTNLARLGFTMLEIEASTPAILSFAAATGAPLADAALIAGTALRSFGASASETEDYVASLAVATTKSALQWSDYSTILSSVAPVAKSAGFTIEQLLGFVGKLRDAGFDASKAATATRNIILNLSDSTGKLGKELGGSAKSFDDVIDAMIALNAKGISLAETLKITDKRSVSAFNAFLRGAEGVRTLAGDVTNVNDKLAEMVKIQMDNVKGDKLLMQSAWQSFILSVEQGDGAIAKFVRGTLRLLTNALVQLANLDLVFTRTNKLTEEQVDRTYDAILSMTTAQSRGLKKVLEEFKDVPVQQMELMRIQVVKALEAVGYKTQEAAKLYEAILRDMQDKAAKAAQLDIDREKAAKEEAEKLAFERADAANKKAEAADKLRLKTKLAAILENNKAAKEANDEFMKDYFDMNDEMMDDLSETAGEELDIFKKTNKEKEKALKDYVDAKQKQIERELEVNAQLLEGEYNIKQAKLDIAYDLTNLLTEMFGKSKGLKKAALIGDSAIAIADVIINTQKTKSATSAWGAALGPAGIILAKILNVLTTIGMGTSIATITAATVNGLSGIAKMATGGRIPGQSYSGDKVPILANSGEVILNQSQQSALGGSNTFRSIGVPGFATGGIVGGAIAPSPGNNFDLRQFVNQLAKTINDKNVVLNLNELNTKQDQLTIINSTSGI